MFTALFYLESLQAEFNILLGIAFKIKRAGQPLSSANLLASPLSHHAMFINSLQPFADSIKEFIETSGTQSARIFCVRQV